MKHPNYLKNVPEMEALFENGFANSLRKLPEIERRHNLSPEEFRKNYLEAYRPVILTGLSKDWVASQKWGFDFFSENYGNIEIQTNLG